MKNIVICGNYGASNLGDEAILDGILTMVKRGLVTAVEGESGGCNITVMSADIEGTRLRLGESMQFTDGRHDQLDPADVVVKNMVQAKAKRDMRDPQDVAGENMPSESGVGVNSSYKTTPNVVPLFPAGIRSLFNGLISGSIWKTIRAVRDADLFILGGGGLFQDEKPIAVVIWSLQAWLARFYKVPIFCFGQSVGPLTTFFGRRVTAGVFKRASIITVRDQSSADVLAGLGVINVKVLADPAFALPSPEPFDERPEKFVVMSLRPWKDNHRKKIGVKNYEILKDFVGWLKSEYDLKTILVPFHIDDVSECSKLLSEPNKFMLKHIESITVQQSQMVSSTENIASEDSYNPGLYEYTSDYNKIIELMSRSTAVIGMRLHSLIFSTLAKTPFIALSYSQKVEAFAHTIDMGEDVLDWNSLTLEDLQVRFKTLMKHRNELSVKAGDGGFVSRKKTLEHEEILRGFFI